MDTEDIVFVVFLVIIVIVGIIIVYRCTRGRPVNTPCSSSSQCIKGLVCDTSLQVCRVPIGSTCRGSGDCTSGAVCTQGACVTQPSFSSIPTGIVTPVIQTGISTTFVDTSYCSTETSSSEDDDTESSCQRSSSIEKYDERSKSFCDSEDFIDIIHHCSSTIKLFSGGMLSTESEQSLSRMRPNIQIIESFGKNLYGVCSGKLYCTTSVRNVEWKEVKIEGKVCHISTTEDGKYFWVQTDNKGVLYDREFSICLKEKTSLIRNYGYNADTYVDCDIINGKSYHNDNVYNLYYSKFDSKGVIGLNRALWKECSNFRVLENDEVIFIKR